MSKIELIATAAFGIESLVAQELSALGYQDQMVENSRVTFKGDEAAIARTNLWLRKADRVLIKIGQFEARTFEELFQKTKALPWPDWLPSNAEFPVEGKSHKSTLFSVSDCQAIVKKAIVEKMKERYKLQWFPENGPRYTIEVAILKDLVTLTLDTSGAGLHKRGYRKLVGQAPLKETLAASLIALSYWRPERVLVDPFCGSGTIPIEAALLGLNIAPGLTRNFAAESWPNIPVKLWREARAEAYDVIRKDVQLDIGGFDIDEKALSLARCHAKEAGVEDHIHFQRRPFLELQSKKKYGYLICNPPYGERLEDRQAVEALYKKMGQIFKKLETWSFYVLTPHPRFESFIGKKAIKNRKLFNGRIECHFYQFHGPGPRKPKDPSGFGE